MSPRVSMTNKLIHDHRDVYGLVPFELTLDPSPKSITSDSEFYNRISTVDLLGTMLFETNFAVGFQLRSQNWTLLLKTRFLYLYVTQERSQERVSDMNA